jgi:ArsR family metal-binding transcriptional regulator
MIAQYYELRLQLPKCSPHAETGSAIAYLLRDISPVLPYLNALLPEARYAPNAPALTFGLEGHHVALWPCEILVGGCGGEAEASGLLVRICGLINDAWERRADIEPDHRGYEQLAPLEALKLLPGTNCKLCGETTCLGFAVKLAAGQATLEGCPERRASEAVR